MKIKPLKATQIAVLERCVLEKDDGLFPRLKLVGCEEACKDIEKYQKFNPNLTCECNSFSTNLGTENSFYYNLLHFRGDQLLLSEVGLGELEEKDGTFYILRKYCLYHQFAEDDVMPNVAFYDPPILEDDYFHVSHFNITNAMQLFITENSVPYASTFGPTALYLENNSLLGRLSENICNIQINDLFLLESFAESVLNVIKTFKNQLVLKVSKLFARSFETNIILLNPSAQTNKPETGTIIVDKKDNKLKYYDGANWLIIRGEKE